MQLFPIVLVCSVSAGLISRRQETGGQTAEPSALPTSQPEVVRTAAVTSTGVVSIGFEQITPTSNSDIVPVTGSLSSIESKVPESLSSSIPITRSDSITLPISSSASFIEPADSVSSSANSDSSSSIAPSSIASSSSNATTSLTLSSSSIITSHTPAGTPFGKRNSTSTTTTSSTKTISGPRLTLRPAIRFDFDTQNLANLEPAHAADLHFSGSGLSDGSQPEYIADLALNMVYPAVVLDHSSFVTVYYDGASNLTVVFASDDSYAMGKTWIPGTLFLAFVPGYGNGGHIYYLSSDIGCDDDDDLVCGITGTDIGLEGAVDAFKVDWGKFQPGLSNSSSMSAFYSNSTSDPFSVPQYDGTNQTTGAACTIGDGFDKCLDNQLGYLDFTGEAYTDSFTKFAPGLTPADLSPPDLSTRRLMTRKCRYFCGGRIIGKGTDPIGDLKKSAKKARDTITKPFEDLYKSSAKLATEAVKVLTELVDHKFTKALKAGFAVKLPRPGSVKTVKSPFPGKATKIYKDGDVDVFCVDCGVNGKITFVGHASASLLKGMIAADVGVYGNFLAVLQIGVSAHGSFRKKVSKDLYEVGVPGLYIPNLLTIGPSIKVGTELQIGVNARGTLLVGAKVSLPAFRATMDFLDNSRSGQSGFTPQITRVFNASGQISAFADYGIPVGLNFGLNVLNGFYTKQISIVEQPGIHAQAKLSGSSSIADGTKIGDATCPGISYEIDFTNKVFVVIPAVKGPPTQKNLFSTKIPAVKGCVTLLNSEVAPSLITFKTLAPMPTTSGILINPTANVPGSTHDTFSESTEISEITALPTVVPTSSYGNLSISLSDSSSAVEPTVASTPPTSITVLASIDFTASTLPNAARVTDIVEVDDSSSDGDAPYTLDAIDPLDTSVDPSDDPLDTDDRTAVIADNLKDADFTSAPIIQAEASFMMKLSDDENLYLDPYGSNDSSDPLANTFAITDGVVTGTIGGQLFHYYTNEIAALNVSRFRASKLDEMPSTANAVFLKPITNDDPGLIAVDTLNSLFYILTCLVVNRGTMTFLATDPDAGIRTLMSEDTREIITGGNVTSCFLATLTIGEGQSS